MFTTKAVAEQMVKQGKGGKIVNIASIAGFKPLVGLDAYVASKVTFNLPFLHLICQHAVIGFSKTAALELAPQKIQVNVISPGAIRTEGSHSEASLLRDNSFRCLYGA